MMALLRESFPNDCKAPAKAAGGAGEGETPETPESSTRLLPLFLAGGVHLPTEVCSMHLFEPRYRLLTHRALDSGGDFAMVWAREAHGFPLLVDATTLPGVGACLVHIDQATPTPDGRWNLLCRGVASLKIEESWVEDSTGSLYMARVRVVEEKPEEQRAPPASGGEPDPFESAPARTPLDEENATEAQCVAYIQTQMHLLGVAQRPGLDAAAPAFLWEAAGCLRASGWGWDGVANEAERQILLELESNRLRLLHLCCLYRRALQQRWSPRAWAAFCLRRWGPLFLIALIAFAASRDDSWSWLR